MRFGHSKTGVWIAIFFVTSTVSAQPAGPASSAPDCIASAAAYHRVNETVLRAIARHESRNNPSLVIANKNGSLDIGEFGINTAHASDLSRFGIGQQELLNGCTNALVAAWLYSKQVERFGNNWLAVGAYHSKTPSLRDAYAQKIYAVVLQMERERADLVNQAGASR